MVLREYVMSIVPAQVSLSTEASFEKEWSSCEPTAPARIIHELHSSMRKWLQVNKFAARPSETLCVRWHALSVAKGVVFEAQHALRSSGRATRELSGLAADFSW